MHTKMVMDGVKAVVKPAAAPMDSILQLTVYLAKLDYYDGMNSVFKTYFPNGGPARTTVAVAGLPGESLVEIKLHCGSRQEGGIALWRSQINRIAGLFLAYSAACRPLC